MTFWEKIFGNRKDENPHKSDSPFDEYRKDLSKQNLKTIQDLEVLVKPLIRKTTILEVQPSSRPPENSQLKSHFGGQPYFEQTEEWPKTKSGKPLDFIFQVFNDGNIELPKEIKLIQFFYDWEELPWDSENDGWHVKIYKVINEQNLTFIERPAELDRPKYCEIKFIPAYSLPDWEGIDIYANLASKLSCVLNEEEPWDSYDKIVEKLIGEQNYQSQLGGYPKWVQGESTPSDKDGNKMKLLFQIDSEDNAGLMWGDVGLVYVFYDEVTERIEFTLQCH